MPIRIKAALCRACRSIWQLHSDFATTLGISAAQ
jgi:hypothetical protein